MKGLKNIMDRSRLNKKGQGNSTLGFAGGTIIGLFILGLIIVLVLFVQAAINLPSLFTTGSTGFNTSNAVVGNITGAANETVEQFPVMGTLLGIVLLLAIILVVFLFLRRMQQAGSGGGQQSL